MTPGGIALNEASLRGRLRLQKLLPSGTLALLSDVVPCTHTLRPCDEETILWLTPPYAYQEWDCEVRQKK